MNFRTLQTAYPLVRGIAIGIVLCLTPAIFAQTQTTLVNSLGQREIRAEWNSRALAGRSVSVGPIPSGQTLVIDNISLQVGGSGAQTYLVQFIVNPNSSTPLIYYFLLSPTTTFAGGVPIGVLNQPTKIRINPGDTLVVSFNGIPTVPAWVDGTISGYTAPYFTSLPF